MNDPVDLTSHPWFFCGIGGSGMLPLAMILNGQGAIVAGSDRSFDQGRLPEKADWLKKQGFRLYPQDGSGITSSEQVLIASAAVEETVPEVARAKELCCRRMTRAELLATLFNASPRSIAVGGTSGKSTVTGMIGWIFEEVGKSPTIMNGAVMKNFVSPEEPFATAKVGRGEFFISEVDESDGSIALYRPEIAVLLNVSLDHKSIEELRALFAGFLQRAQIAAVNWDDEDALCLGEKAKEVVSFAIEHPRATIGVQPGTIVETATGISALVVDRRNNEVHPLSLRVPGRHNLSNALAALAAGVAAGISLHDAVIALHQFSGLARRFDIVGTTSGGVTVIDDFAHNPDKCRATFRALKASPGRVIAFFQPHGYGPLRQMGHELARVFAKELGPEDISIVCDPVYFGGTVDRSQGSERFVQMIEEAGGQAEYIAARQECAERIVDLARPGDRIVIMGARDDTLQTFARGILDSLPG